MLSKHLLNKPLPLRHTYNQLTWSFSHRALCPCYLHRSRCPACPLTTTGLYPQPSCLLMSFLLWGECMVSLPTCPLGSLLGKPSTLPTSHSWSPRPVHRQVFIPRGPRVCSLSSLPLNPLQSALPTPGLPRGKEVWTEVPSDSHPEKTKIVARGKGD